MRSDLIRFSLKSLLPKSLPALSLLVSLTCPSAQAITIDFDDIDYVIPEDECDCFYVHPLSDEYADKGLTISGGFLQTYREYHGPEEIVSQPNFLLGGNTMELYFGTRHPTFVSMYVTTFLGEAMIFDIYGSDGWLRQVLTPGYAGSETDPVAEPRHFVSFRVDEGISSIRVQNYYNSRVSGRIDDLTYTYAVNEPFSVMLLAGGLAGIFLRRKLRPVAVR